MEVHFQPTPSQISRVRGKEERKGGGGAFQQALANEKEGEKEEEAPERGPAGNRETLPLTRMGIRPKTRSSDGKGLKIDLLA